MEALRVQVLHTFVIVLRYVLMLLIQLLLLLLLWLLQQPAACSSQQQPTFAFEGINLPIPAVKQP